MPRVPQRNINLATQLLRAIELGNYLARQLTEDTVNDQLLNELEEKLFDSFVAVRQFRKKVNLIHQKGQSA